MPLYVIAAAILATALAAHTIRHRRTRARERAAADYRAWREWVDLMRREMERLVTIDVGARAVGRKPSTLNTWVSRGKLKRADAGGQGTKALVKLGDVYLAEHGVRGRGRPTQKS
jgi:hypothetical protein